MARFEWWGASCWPILFLFSPWHPFATCLALLMSIGGLDYPRLKVFDAAPEKTRPRTASPASAFWAKLGSVASSSSSYPVHCYCQCLSAQEDWYQDARSYYWLDLSSIHAIFSLRWSSSPFAHPYARESFISCLKDLVECFNISSIYTG